MTANHDRLRTNSDLVKTKLYELIASLQKIAGNRRVFFAQVPRAKLLLESLPLSTEEYDLSQRRLKNARRYIESNEPGAAKYELKLLAVSFRPLFGAAAISASNKQLLAGQSTHQPEYTLDKPL